MNVSLQKRGPSKPLRGRKTWNEKLADAKGLPKIINLEGRMQKKWGEGTCAIPAPIEVDGLMRKVGKGKLTTIDDLRKALARSHETTIACPITTGIFAWIAAYAADESATAGKSKVTPYWRTLKAGGELNPKYPGGIDALTLRLEAEGHVVFQKGRRYFVRDFEKSLAKL